MSRAGAADVGGAGMRRGNCQPPSPSLAGLLRPPECMGIKVSSWNSPSLFGCGPADGTGVRRHRRKRGRCRDTALSAQARSQHIQWEVVVPGRTSVRRVCKCSAARACVSASCTSLTPTRCLASWGRSPRRSGVIFVACLRRTLPGQANPVSASFWATSIVWTSMKGAYSRGRAALYSTPSMPRRRYHRSWSLGRGCGARIQTPPIPGRRA